MTGNGGREWYQSIGLAFAYHSAKFLNLFKGPSPFKLHKTLFSGYTAFMCPDWIMWPPVQKTQYRDVYLRYRLCSGRIHPAIGQL